MAAPMERPFSRTGALQVFRRSQPLGDAQAESLSREACSNGTRLYSLPAATTLYDSPFST